MTNSAIPLVTMKKMWNTFVMLGLPEIPATDNRTIFISAEFEHFASAMVSVSPCL